MHIFVLLPSFGFLPPIEGVPVRLIVSVVVSSYLCLEAIWLDYFGVVSVGVLGGFFLYRRIFRVRYVPRSS